MKSIVHKTKIVVLEVQEIDQDKIMTQYECHVFFYIIWNHINMHFKFTCFFDNEEAIITGTFSVNLKFRLQGSRAEPRYFPTVSKSFIFSSVSIMSFLNIITPFNFT